MHDKQKNRAATNWPTFWFVALERAIEDGDYDKAAEAQRQLKRLGVEVKFVRQPEAVAHA